MKAIFIVLFPFYKTGTATQFSERHKSYLYISLYYFLISFLSLFLAHITGSKGSHSPVWLQTLTEGPVSKYPSLHVYSAMDPASIVPLPFLLNNNDPYSGAGGGASQSDKPGNMGGN